MDYGRLRRRRGKLHCLYRACAKTIRLVDISIYVAIRARRYDNFVSMNILLTLQDDDPENSWHMLQENDLVALLNQIPVSLAFRHVLGVRTSSDSKSVRHVLSVHTSTHSASIRHVLGVHTSSHSESVGL